MKRYTHKSCRRYGIKLCQSEKCPVVTRNYPPGIHGPKGRGRITQFGLQMAEKQKAKILYGVTERQFRNYYEKAIGQKGDTGELLQQLLETRLDNVVYRSGFAKTRAQARQFVNHGFFAVNGKKVDIPSYQVKAKEVLTILGQKASTSKAFTKLEETLKKHQAPSWIHLNLTETKATIVTKPLPAECEQAFNPRSIVEFYSK